MVGKSKLYDHEHPDDSLDGVARNYIKTHGKDLHGQPLGKYFIHGLSHSVGIDVHDPFDSTKPLERGEVFTIEPGIYLPEEKIGVRIEDTFYVDQNGKLQGLRRKPSAHGGRYRSTDAAREDGQFRGSLMPLLRSFISIAGGFACIALCVALTTFLTQWLIPSWSRMPPSRMAQVFNLSASCLFGFAGGHVAAMYAPVSPLVHSLILAMIVLLVSTIAASELRGEVKGFYPLALAVMPSAATLGGGILTVLHR